jgi:DNA polymerase III subunit delta'
VEPDVFAGLELDPRALLKLRAAVADPVHAYLLSGPPESAANDAATRLAAALAGVTLGQVQEGHPDVIEAIREGQVIRLEQIAAIWQAVHLRPHSGIRVVAIVREAHAMSEIVQNALLKSIEEPPPHAVTILVTHLPHQLLATVRSRCQEIVIAPPPRREPAPDWVVDIARAALRDPAFDPAAAVALHVKAAGALERGALREVDERFAGRREGVEFLPAAIRNKEKKKADAEHKELSGRRKRQTQAEAAGATVDGLASWFRDVLCTASGAESVVVHSARLPELREDAEGDPAVVEHALEAALDTRRALQLTITPELAIEALLHRVRLARTT